jgi:RNA polymerase sigma factor (sigma-70 family)
VGPSNDADSLLDARRDPEAFALFYRRHNTRVLRYFAARTPTPEAAADLTAETFAAAFAALDRYRPARGPAVVWLFAIAHNLLHDAYRRGVVSARARERLALEPLWLDDDDIQRIQELTGVPSVEQMLEGLSEDERSAIRARILDERSYDEIATALQCSTSVIRKRVSRGLARLRTSLETNYE